MDSRRMKTLLSKTSIRLIMCMAVVFVLLAPLFYFITRQYYAEDMIDVIESVRNGSAIPSIDLEEDILEGMMIHFVLMFLAICIAIFITMRLATKHLWKPFDDTLRKTERFNITQGRIPEFQETDVKEFDRLNRSLEKLMRKDSETFRIQKEFSENASHELQTPLAVMCSKLDLLMQEDLNGRQMQLVDTLYRLTTRMSHLNRNLLLLAKIDNAQYATRTETDVMAIYSEQMPLYDALLHGQKISVDDRRTEQRQPLLANEVLLDCLLKNLIVNAIRHTEGEGEILLTIDDGSLSVSNPSADGSPLDRNDLFERFRSGDVNKGGNGLGLAIVKAICRFHGWTADYTFTGGQHRFSVSFS